MWHHHPISLLCDLGFYVKLHRCREHAAWSSQSRQRGKVPLSPFPFVAIIYASCFFVTRWWLPMMSEWRRVQCGHWRWGALACSPSLNSLRSNLQTAAEFWQILPRCLLPLGDTFFIYFSSPLLWYSLHGALAPQAIVSSVLLPCLKNQMDLQGLLSTPPLFWAYKCGIVFYFHSFISTLSIPLWWLGLSSPHESLLLWL